MVNLNIISMINKNKEEREQFERMKLKLIQEAKKSEIDIVKVCNGLNIYSRPDMMVYYYYSSEDKTKQEPMKCSVSTMKRRLYGR